MKFKGESYFYNEHFALYIHPLHFVFSKINFTTNFPTCYCLLKMLVTGHN